MPDRDPVFPERHNWPDQFIAQYIDGSMAWHFVGTGMSMKLGPASNLKWAQNFRGTDMAIITTQRGERYGLGHGYVIDFDSRRDATPVTDETFEVTIGEICTIPDFGTTDYPIDSIALRYKIAEANSPIAQVQVPDMNPFDELTAYLELLEASSS